MFLLFLNIMKMNSTVLTYCPFSFLDVEGLASQIIIEANDGVNGVVEWESTK